MSSSINFTSQRISFVNKISVLQKALSDDETPTPSYLYKDINDISFESVGYCESLVEYVVDRLRHKSCHVKLKVLKVMKYVLEHGSKEFQLGLRHHVSVVKEATKFSGPPHPVHGNTPYTMVRNMAVELCEKLYNMDPLSLKSDGKDGEQVQSPQGKYGGMGPSRSGGAIQGFGNSPQTQSKGFTGTILHEIEKLGTRLTETPADRQAAVLAKLNLSASSSNYQPPVVSPDTSETVMLQSREQSPATPCGEQAVEKPVSRHLPGKAGGGWNDDDDVDDCLLDNEALANEDGKETGGRPGQEIQDTEPSEILESQELSAEEQILVEDILNEDSSSTNERIGFLPNNAIEEFLQKCSKLKCSIILDCVCQSLTQGDPDVCGRSLQLLEGIIYSRKELINIEVLAVRCKAALVDCYSKAGNESSDMDVTVLNNCEKWKCVQTKAAKLILILQRLSSQKDILSSAQIANELFRSPVSTPGVTYKMEVATS